MTSSLSGLSARDAHSRMRSALNDLQRAERSAVLCFAEIMKRKLYRELGYSSIHHYAGEALGFSKPRISQFVRLATSLDELPKLRESLATGEIPWTKAREVANVATKSTEQRWLEAAKGSSRRALEEKIARVRNEAKNRRKRSPQQASLIGLASANYREVSTNSNLNSEQNTANELPRDSVELAADLSSTLALRLDAEQYARYEAIVEKLHKLASRSGECSQRRNREMLFMEGLEAVLANELMDSNCRETESAPKSLRQPACPGASAELEAKKSSEFPRETEEIANQTQVPTRSSSTSAQPAARPL